MDYVNYTKQAEFEYMPMSYQTGAYDQKWTDKLCVQNYKIGAVITEMYTNTEHLQKTAEVRTRNYNDEKMFSIFQQLKMKPNAISKFGILPFPVARESLKPT